MFKDDMIGKEIKNKRIKALKQSFQDSKAAFLVNCKGLNVERMTALRKALSKSEGALRIERNTLALLSLKDHSALQPLLAPQIKGPNGYVFAFGEDVPAVAKIMDSFAEENEAFQIKLGVVEGRGLNPEDVKMLARLPSKEALRAQFLFLLTAAPGRFLGVLKAPASRFARLLAIYKAKQEKK